MNRHYSPRTPQPPSSSLRHNLPLIIALILIISGVVGYGLDKKSKTRELSAFGGTYTEGIVADSPTKVDKIIARLTSIGLTYQESNGTIKPALADSWDIAPDNKTYLFHIHPGYDANGLVSTIQNSKTSWNNVAISAPTMSTLQFVLADPMPLFLSSTTVPLFPYGPYQVVKREKEDTILRANEKFILGKPFIQKIFVKTYESLDKLLAAARDGEIDGTADFSVLDQSHKDEIPKALQEYTLKLPRYYILFFNLSKPGLVKLQDRERIIQANDGPPATYTLLTSQTGNSSDLADALVKSLALKHITLVLQKKAGATLQKEDIAKRDFDLLLYGIDYGVNHDYYPFWHSSQATANGLNIDGVKDKALDNLLDQSRQSTDLAKREAINSQINEYLAGQALQKVMSQDEANYWLNSSIKKVKYGTIEEANDRFSLVWQWYIKTKKAR